MAVPNNVILLWNGTNAEVTALTNYSRETTLDGKYILGAASGVEPNATGGQTTHDHASPAHNHTQDSHLHTVTGAADTESGKPAGAGTAKFSTKAHTHNQVNSATATATNQTTVLDVNTTANDLTGRKVIFIKSNGTDDVPDDGVAFFDNATLPASWTKILDNKWLVGAGAAADASDNSPANPLEAHNHTTVAHTHTQDAHGHTSTASGTSVGSALGTGTGDYSNPKGHTHLVNLNAATAVNQDATVTLDGTEDGRPPYKRIFTIQNETGGDDLPDGIIGLWLGAKADIPTNWAEYTAMQEKFLEVTTVDGELGDTGGTDQHDHTANTHTHTQTAHDHPTSMQAAPTMDTVRRGFSFPLSWWLHTHVWTIGTTAAVNQSTVATISNNTTKHNYPEYRTVAYIKYTEPAASGQVIGVVIT
jgi:hypothetical protein